jgi:UTP--glucose-1-phosphate uridylyltransferase
MFPVLDKPAIQYVVEEAVSAGSDSVVFVTSPGKESILDHFDKINAKFPILKLADKTQNEINKLNNLVEVISVRQKKQKGLGHAVLTGAQVTGDSSFSVLLPDMLIFPKNNISSMKKMMQLHKKTGASVIALMKVPENRKHMYGIIEGIESQKNTFNITKLIEKPSSQETDSCLAIVGRYIFTDKMKSLLETTKPGKKGEIDLADAMTELLKSEKIYGLLIDDDSLVFDTGNSQGFVLANTYLGLKTFPTMKNDLLKLLEDTE